MAVQHPSHFRLLWWDAGPGLVVGVGTLALHAWLATLYAVPVALVSFVGAMNLVYGSYSGALAWRAARGRPPSRRAIDVLVAANLAWALVCAALFAWTFGSASALGLAHFALEGAFVAVLARVEHTRLRPLTRN